MIIKVIPINKTIPYQKLKKEKKTMTVIENPLEKKIKFTP